MHLSKSIAPPRRPAQRPRKRRGLLRRALGMLRHLLPVPDLEALMTIGKTRWAVAEGYSPPDGTDGEDRRFPSHETACMLNANDRDARLRITLYFSDREPVGL